MGQQHEPEWWKIEEAKKSLIDYVRRSSLCNAEAARRADGVASKNPITLDEHLGTCKTCDSSLEQTVLGIHRLLNFSKY